MLYLDANIFIFASLNTKEIGSKAESLLDRVQRGEETAITSALTFDEVFWEVERNRGLEKALEVSEAMLYYPNLNLIAADRETVVSAIQVIKKYHLAPRDALHAATAILKQADYFLTTDPDFKKVKELKTQGL